MVKIERKVSAPKPTGPVKVKVEADRPVKVQKNR